ncbi:MAG: hypothetical protein M3437_05070 [Chloroflexota bacterium]|nr:hypothetical protein [Chloroflexota bacterium]MDQ5864602.1 hypothetical protein [Chloroflexota bacterium]
MRTFFKWVAITAGIVVLSALVLVAKEAIEQQWWRALEPQPVIVATATTATLANSTPIDVSDMVPSSVPTLGPAPNAIATREAMSTELARPVASPTPQPIARFVRLDVVKPPAQSGSQITGEPPLTVEFAATTFNVPGNVKCRATRWDWGDGIVETKDCAATQNPQGQMVYSAGHTYERVGTHRVDFAIEFSDGSVLVSSESVVVGAPMPPRAQDASTDVGMWLLLGASIAMATAAAIALRRWGGRWRRVGYVAILLLLLGLVPPISYLPSPLGLFWLVCDCYSYDPRLPVRNAFVVAGSPEDQLRARLNSLLGATGLSPLHPAQPLRGYEFLSVKVKRPGFGAPDAFVTTRLTYQDGSQRDFDIPVLSDDLLLGAYRFTRFTSYAYSNYYSTLNRLFTVHEEFTEAPFAEPDGPITLSTPERLSLHPDAQRLDAGNLSNWNFAFSGWGVYQSIVMSPDGSEFLVTDKYGYRDDRRDLWLVKLDGSPPRRIAENVLFYAWSPDGGSIVYNTAEEGLPVYSAGKNGENRRKLVQNGYAVQVVATAEGAWFAENDALWVAPLDGGPPRRLSSLLNGGTGTKVVPAPGGKRVAYACGPAVCIQDPDGKNWTRTELQPGEIAWNLDGSRLAVVSQAGMAGDPYRLYNTPIMSILDRQGRVITSAPLAPNGPTGTPQWTPDGRYIFIQTAPEVGRRIVAVEAATGLSVDLTQPRWDPWFTLTPDGKYVIMANGRGDFWRGEVLVKSPTNSSSQTVP